MLVDGFSFSVRWVTVIQMKHKTRNATVLS